MEVNTLFWGVMSVSENFPSLFHGPGDACEERMMYSME